MHFILLELLPLLPLEFSLLRIVKVLGERLNSFLSLLGAGLIVLCQTFLVCRKILELLLVQLG